MTDNNTPIFPVDIIWEGCDVADVIAQVSCNSLASVSGLAEIMQLADKAKTADGFKPKLGLRIYDNKGNELHYAGTREGWQIPDLEFDR